MAEAILVNRTRFTSSLKNELMKDFDILAQKTRIPKSLSFGPNIRQAIADGRPPDRCSYI